MKSYIERRAQELAVYIIENKTTVRDAAKEFSISKSTVHKDVAERLWEINRPLAKAVQTVLSENKADRHLRGGRVTKQKYERLKAQKVECDR